MNRWCSQARRSSQVILSVSILPREQYYIIISTFSLYSNERFFVVVVVAVSPYSSMHLMVHGSMKFVVVSFAQY